MTAERNEHSTGDVTQAEDPENVALVADENAVSEAVNDDNLDTESELASIASSILAYRQENGRTYHAYKDGVYVLPNDQAENDRLDLQHNLLLLTFDGKLHCAPLDKTPQRVLDAGCGTGIWSIEFADQYPDCQITGVDLSPIQPQFVPPNVSFHVDDLEDDWTFSEKFDFIFSRFMTGSIRNWSKYLKQCYESLEPGGTLELMDIIYPIKSDDGTLTEHAAIDKWSKLLEEGFAKGGHSMRTALSYRDWLKDAGFADIVEVKEKWPINTWAKDSKYKQIGSWTYENAVQALEPLSLAIFTRPESAGGLGWELKDLQELLTLVRRDFGNRSIHAYWPIYSVRATKPQ